jgi:hypothetical protein
MQSLDWDLPASRIMSEINLYSLLITLLQALHYSDRKQILHGNLRYSLEEFKHQAEINSHRTLVITELQKMSPLV